MLDDFIRDKLTSYDEADSRHRREMFLMALELIEHYRIVLLTKDQLILLAKQAQD